MPSFPSFDLLDATLAREGVTSSDRLARFLPFQRAVATERDLGEALKVFLDAHAGGARSVVVYVDGVRKDCGVGIVDDAVRFVLDAAGIQSRWVDLARVLKISQGQIHASYAHLERIRDTLRGGKESVVVVLGSGSLTDLVKHALFEEGDRRPFLVLPTALTVTAFTSAFAVLEEAGAKRTRPSRPVTGCLWFAPVLAQAPGGMSRAGYGDLLARFVAYGDWYLAHEMAMAENYDERAYRLMEPFAPLLKDSAPDFAGEVLPSRCVERVSAALSMAGIAMSVSGETTPLSGYEHVISHALDFLRLISHRPLVLHGEQVALASLTSASSYEYLLEMPIPDTKKFRKVSDDKVRQLVASFVDQAPLFGTGEVALSETERRVRHDDVRASLAEAVEHFTKEYLKKHAKWEAFQPQVPALLARWPEVKEKLRSFVLPPRAMEELLAKAKLPLVPEDTEPSTTALEYRWAVRFSPFVRARMSLGDFLFWIGEDPAHVGAV